MTRCAAYPQTGRLLPGVVLALTACTTSLDPVETPGAEIEAETLFSVSETRPPSRIDWWVDLGSSELDQIIARLRAKSPDLAAASLRELKTRLELGNALATLAPTITGTASSSGTSAVGAAGARATTESFDLSTTVSWEADLWGRLARQGDAAAAQLLASENDSAALEASLIATAARHYIGITFDRRQIAATQRVISSREATLSVTRTRFQRGVTGTDAGTVSTAEENLAAARADLPDLQLSLVQTSNALTALTGQLPRSATSYAGKLPRALPKRMGGVGTPLQLLDNRPDIRAASAALLAANANLDVSVASRFPSLTLSGSLRSSGGDLGSLLDVDNLIASLAADLMLTLFDGGRGKRLVAMRRADAQELAQVYISTVLSAVREVEDALSAERLLAERSRLLAARLAAARRATQIAEDRYRSGTGNYLTLLDSSRSAAAAETAFLNVERRRWLTRVDLMLALGAASTPTFKPENAE